MISALLDRVDRCQRTISNYCDNHDQSNLIDLLADAMHWCDANGEDFHICLAMACRHYIDELNDQQRDERRVNP